MKLLPRLAVLAATFGATVGFDQTTKRLATEAFQGKMPRIYFGDLFRFTWATNDGAFLSLGGNMPELLRFWVLTVGVGLLLLAIAIYAMVAKGLDGAQVAGYSLIAGGGFSNWVDRARFDGKVVDFMNMGLGSLRTGVFNVADLAILAGIGVLMVISWRQDKAAKIAARRAAQSQPPTVTP